MRPFRNSIGSVVLFAAAGLLALECCADEPRSTQKLVAKPATNSFFPLAVGNSWTYRCSVEGEFQFAKTLAITSETVKDGRRLFRAEMRTKGDSSPLISYLSVDAVGNVVTSLNPAQDRREILITARPKIGDRIERYRVAAVTRSHTKVFQSTDVVRLENFSMDDPTVPEDRRLEWLSRSYGRGVGPVEEADGLGGACVLSKFRLSRVK